MESKLLEELETWRCRMYSVAAEKDLCDPEVLKISERLDALINEFYALQEQARADAA